MERDWQVEVACVLDAFVRDARLGSHVAHPAVNVIGAARPLNVERHAQRDRDDASYDSRRHNPVFRETQCDRTSRHNGGL